MFSLAARFLASQKPHFNSQKAGRSTKTRPGFSATLAEMQIALEIAQSIPPRLGGLLDDFIVATNGSATATFAQGLELIKNYQTAKWEVNWYAIETVNQAMDLNGGGVFMAGSALLPQYRDVRADPFTQSYPPIDARDYVRKVLKVLLADFPEA